jgi:hypothetical protein
MIDFPYLAVRYSYQSRLTDALPSINADAYMWLPKQKRGGDMFFFFVKEGV